MSVAAPARRPNAPPAHAGASGRPRVMFVGGTRYTLPLAPGLARKWEALGEVLEPRVVARGESGAGGDERFSLIDPGVRGPAFYAALAARVAGEARRFRPQAVVAQSPYEACACLAAWAGRTRPPIVAELHADWRTASRLYGSRLRRAYSGLADRAALWALRRADATKALSPFTQELAQEATGRPPVATFPAYIDLESFTATPPAQLPEHPSVAWIGVLQRYKDPEMLAQAWRLVSAQVPEARLVIVGRGPLQRTVDALVARYPGRVRAIPRLEPPEIARLLDESTVLALSSAKGTEGLPRVIMEAFARARPVVCTGVGGIPDIVEPGRNGLLVDPGRPQPLARALVRVLTDRSLAERLGAGAHEDARRAQWSPRSYAEAVRSMIDSVLEA